MNFRIFGINSRTRTKINDPVMIGHCDHCGNDVWFTHVVVRKWLTLAMIPVLPLEPPQHKLVCGMCYMDVDVEPGAESELDELADVAKDFRQGRVSDDTFIEQINEFVDHVPMGVKGAEASEVDSPEQLSYIQ